MIGSKKLLELVNKNNLVENLSERELINPEGSGFDLRVSEIFEIDNDEAFLGINERFTPKVSTIAVYGKDKDILIRPQDFFLVKTMEKVNLPNNIAAIFRPRSTLQRCGIGLFSAAVSPGYKGELTFGICNFGKNNFKLELGSRIVHILFFDTSENISNYRGQWQGGRVSTDGEIETQV
jgi:deoxycytidine triphosphate deaminase